MVFWQTITYWQTIAFWQTIEYWQGIGSGIVLSFLFWLCLFITYKAGRESVTEEAKE